MATKEIVQIICNACWNKSGAVVEAVEQLTLGSLEWDLCEEHRDRFGGLLSQALDINEPIAVSA
ncbi:hypothetical protein ACIQC7_08820 [Kitasatospora sp. NPDC088556]|uniref:hypothetical protein n=1 Tax=Kitasatospora sp. NPDC088556 TaxID=3364076 RepID=UPI0038152D64